MDPLEYFEEEYQNFNNSVSEVNSLLVQSKDIYSNFIHFQEELLTVLQDKNLDIKTINKILLSLESLMQNSREFLDTAEKSMNAVNKQRI